MKQKTLITSIALGILFDILFWDKAQGISFFIFILVLLSFAFFILGQRGMQFNQKGFFFLIPIGFFSIMSFVYSAPLISFLNRTLALVLVGIWSAGLMDGAWTRFGLIDYLTRGIRLFWDMISLPWLRANTLGFFPEEQQSEKGNLKPIIRGLLLAAPIALIFLVLFSSADLVFSERLRDLFAIFDLDSIAEYSIRVLFIILTANAFLGLLLFAARDREEEPFVGEDKPFIKPFLSATETGIVLSSVVLLFLAFIILQFKYFFFNQTAIAEFGFSFSEYARRGFGELIAVSVISLGLILILSTLTKVNDKKQGVLLSWLYSSLVVGNLVILVSAFMRLSLYESAFGFTRLRATSYVFIIWLGLLLAAIGFLVWLKKTRQFTNVFLLFIIGFTATLNLLNMDAFIANRNINRSMGRKKMLDSAYLASLSSDAVPALVSQFETLDHLPHLKRDIGAAIVCYQQNNQWMDSQESWQTFNLSRHRARRLLASLESDLEGFVIRQDEWTLVVIDETGHETECTYSYFMD